MTPNSPKDADHDQTPQRLRDAFARLDRQHQVLVPPAMDERILTAAREHLSQIEPRHVRQPQPFWWTAIAASFLLIAWLAWSIFRPGAETPLSRLPNDRNGDGVVDILDALTLAYQTQQPGAVPAGMDLNQDGVTDQRDARFLADQVVRLNQSNPS